VFYGDVNSFVIKKNVAYLFLTKGQKTIIDLEDLERVLDYRWCTYKGSSTFYAVNNTAGYLHQFLTGYKFKAVDHIDRDGSNNRKSNLRNAVDPQGLRLNQRNCGLYQNNTTGFKGVSFDKQHQKFQAKIQLNGKSKHLGFFDTAEEAHAAYCTAANELFGAFARCE
jgi:AP2 domain